MKAILQQEIVALEYHIPLQNQHIVTAILTEQHIRMHIATVIPTEHLIQLLIATAIAMQHLIQLDTAILLLQQQLHKHIAVEPHKLLKAIPKE